MRPDIHSRCGKCTTDNKKIQQAIKNNNPNAIFIPVCLALVQYTHNTVCVYM